MVLDIKVIKKESYAYSVESKGPIDTVTSPQLKKELEEIIDDKTKAVVLDMTDVDYVSSKGPGTIVWAQKALKRIRAYPNNRLYPQGKPDACVVGQKRSQRGENHFWRAFLACRLGLELFARPHNDPVIRISSKCVLCHGKPPTANKEAL